MITIYGRANSSNVRKVLWLAEELGLEVDRRDYGRGYAPTDTPEFKALNPNAKVPVMDEDGFILWESHAILRYLAAKYGPEWYPADLRARAIVDQWMDWLIIELQEPVRRIFFALHVKPGSDPEGMPQHEAESAKACSILDAQLQKTGAYVAGAQPTIADCAIGMMVHRWYYFDIQRPNLPALEAYYERLKTRPAFQGPILNAGV
ncbi:glutathione S-transferase family protein [Dichotomicrobium thermohalophilum]|uniref:Glutathione S-transferase n=1 Tax=Dichotomicrobium thermohalophilum TaxID=933063 RepID=A0A397Q714_9HYPH|nr:glutathione S-transferase family protein [Dichotomicrobium thermohalophilum]RIA56848.1 glutathione S-transferase [Dichotomicrobium thermohalophilum]